MAEIDFSRKENVVTWLRSQNLLVNCARTSRAALRVACFFGRFSDEQRSNVTLIGLRCILLAICRSRVESQNTTFDWGQAANLAFSALNNGEIHEESQTSAGKSAAAAASAVKFIDPNFFPQASVFFSSASAAQSDGAAMRAAAIFDAKLDLESMHSSPVWAASDVPFKIATQHTSFLKYLSSEVEWSFWKRFYEKMWGGTFDEWPLAIEVMKIPNTDWLKGHKHIAELIRRLEIQLEQKNDPEQSVEAQAIALLSKPKTSALAVDGLAQLIEMAALEYKREISNALPEELGPLENLPPILRTISVVLTSSVAATTKEEQLQRALLLMAQTVEDLNSRLKRSSTELETLKRDGSGRVLFAEAFYKKAGERSAELITSKVLWGGLVSGVGFVLGGGSAEALTQGLQGCFQLVIEPESKLEALPYLKPK